MRAVGRDGHEVVAVGSSGHVPEGVQQLVGTFECAGGFLIRVEVQRMERLLVQLHRDAGLDLGVAESVVGEGRSPFLSAASLEDVLVCLELVAWKRLVVDVDVPRLKAAVFLDKLGMDDRHFRAGLTADAEPAHTGDVLSEIEYVRCVSE